MPFDTSYYSIYVFYCISLLQVCFSELPCKPLISRLTASSEELSPHNVLSWIEKTFWTGQTWMEKIHFFMHIFALMYIDE